MANSIGSNPWILDTPGAIWPVGARVFVKHFEFSQYAAATDTVTVKDGLGRIVWAARGTTDLQEVRSAEAGWMNGLTLDTITAGVCRVYIK